MSSEDPEVVRRVEIAQRAVHESATRTSRRPGSRRRGRRVCPRLLFLLHRDLVDVVPPHEAVRIPSGLVDDTYRLASRHVPAADLEPLRAAFELRRVTEQSV